MGRMQFESMGSGSTRRYLELLSGDIGFASRVHIVGSRWDRLAREDLVGRVSKSSLRK